MTRSEVAETVQTVLQQTHAPVTLMEIRALPFAWQLRFEDLDGVDRYVTVHQGSVASIYDSIAHALDPQRACYVVSAGAPQNLTRIPN
jgi:nitrous oxide reductase accessory protein NosL